MTAKKADEKPDTEWKFTYKEFKRLQELSLEDKIERAKMLIRSELQKHKRPSVSCSWGKASVVMTHLVLSCCDNVVICFQNTGVEYPQTLEYRDKLLKEWKVKNYHETKPYKDMTFFKCVKQYGYPKFRQMSGQGKNRTPKCCFYLKEKPAMMFLKEFNIDLEFVGLQASESMVRRLSFLREGEVFDSKKYKTRICRPLMIWTDDDIWAYNRKFKIPKNPLYDLMDRNGCMPCTGFKNWKAVMNKASPKLYRVVSKQIGEPILKEWCK